MMNVFQLIDILKQSITKHWIAPSPRSIAVQTSATRPRTELEKAVLALNSTYTIDENFKKHAQIFRDATALIHADEVVQKSNEIRSFGYRTYNYYLRAETLDRKVERLCLKVPNFSFFLLHSFSGYDREIALKHIDDELSVFEAMHLIYLVNNWVDEVRLAAMNAFERCIPKTATRTIVTIFPVFIKNSQQWSRWEPEHQTRIREQLLRPDVIELILHELIEQPTPYAIRLLNFLLKEDHIDDKLEHIRLNAQTPSARAIATKVLLFGEATWKNGYTRKWVDKSLGVSRREPVIERRTLNTALQKEPILADAIKSPYWSVRKIAADALIKYRDELDLPIEQLAQQFLLDKYPSIQERGKFLLSKI